MIDKLKFNPVEGHVLLDYINKKSKLTPKKEIDLALRILDKFDTKTLRTYFQDVYNAMVEVKWNKEQEEEKKRTTPVNDDTSQPPEAA